jgi:hypothetical protein
LKKIGKALFAHVDSFLAYPAGIVGTNGTLGLSWRVQLLAYMGTEENKLYEQFNLKEPWDGPTNSKLLEKMPSVYASPGKKTPSGKTHLRSFSGETAFLQGTSPKGGKEPPPYAGATPGLIPRGRTIVSITDGTSNTLAVAEAVEPVEWTKPDDLPFYGFPTKASPELPKVPKLGGVYAGGFHGLMADGKVVFFPADLSEADLRALITVNTGDNFGPKVMKALYPEAQPKVNPLAGPLKKEK